MKKATMQLSLEPNLFRSGPLHSCDARYRPHRHSQRISSNEEILNHEGFGLGDSEALVVVMTEPNHWTHRPLHLVLGHPGTRTTLHLLLLHFEQLLPVDLHSAGLQFPRTKKSRVNHYEILPLSVDRILATTPHRHLRPQ